MDKLKLIFIAGITILFVGSSFIALFGAGKTLETTLKSYVFKVKDCRYDYTQRPIISDKGEVIDYEKPVETCGIDYNQTKREMSNGLAMFLVSLPVILFAFWQGIKLLKSS